MPTVTIDDVQVEIEQGQTILDAACKAGIWIPALCYHPSVEPKAGCRLCMVELVQGDSVRLVTSCNYEVYRDITVKVSSERAVHARKGVMELLLARAPESEELKTLAEKMGVISTPYPSVTESQRNCILCGLCTSVCEEVIGKAAISFAGRGKDKAVAPPFRQAAEDCIACGACAAVCPVGTIQMRYHEDTHEIEISPFKARAKLGVCKECGAQLVPVPVSEEVFKHGKIDAEELRTRADLCPDCRRKRSAETMYTSALSSRNTSI